MSQWNDMDLVSNLKISKWSIYKDQVIHNKDKCIIYLKTNDQIILTIRNGKISISSINPKLQTTNIFISLMNSILPYVLYNMQYYIFILD